MILGIETSDLLCSVAYVNNNQILAEYNHEMPKQHASLIGNLVKNGGEFLSLNKMVSPNFMDNLKLVAVSIGPGSFTGLRIGLSYAQGMCMSKKIPIIGVNNHQILAENCPYGYNNSVFTIIDARQNDVYLGKMVRNYTYFEIEDHRIVDKRILVDEIPENSVLIISTLTRFKESILKDLLKRKISIINSARYSAALTAKIGWQKYQQKGEDSLAELEPLYIRPFAGVQ